MLKFIINITIVNFLIILSITFSNAGGFEEDPGPEEMSVSDILNEEQNLEEEFIEETTLEEKSIVTANEEILEVTNEVAVSSCEEEENVIRYSNSRSSGCVTWSGGYINPETGLNNDGSEPYYFVRY